jgi:hypothetical protein
MGALEVLKQISEGFGRFVGRFGDWLGGKGFRSVFVGLGGLRIHSFTAAFRHRLIDQP